MKSELVAAINRHQRRVHHYRGMMQDHYSHWSHIKRPKGMKKYLFRNRIARLRHHEEEIERLIEEGLKQYIAKGR